MLKTLRALRAPESHCFLYPSMVGFNESANLPMMGIVQLSPGRCFFLYRYTDCSRARSAKMMASVVYIHVAAFDAAERRQGSWMLERLAREVAEGTGTEAERTLNMLAMMERRKEAESVGKRGRYPDPVLHSDWFRLKSVHFKLIILSIKIILSQQSHPYTYPAPPSCPSSNGQILALNLSRISKSTTLREASVSVSIQEINLWRSYRQPERIPRRKHLRLECIHIEKPVIEPDWWEFCRRRQHRICIPLDVPQQDASGRRKVYRDIPLCAVPIRPDFGTWP